ncbi:ImmA/IrrE family metallo-endopeptidase [Myxococcota bacterium]|jgi:hypothetical protein|nr:ImmA/IrrE family metallo-endopeptidase [Myxococcota bacterium]
MRRLADAGFPRDFARAAVLPDWWEAECARDPDLLPDIELRVARFIRAPLSVVRDPAAALVAPGVPGARLRRVRTARPDRLAPAVYTGLQIAAAAVRCLREPARGLRVPPADAKAWRKEVPLNKMAVDLKGVVADLWARGIPVLHVEVLPTPSYQGMACVVEGRPVVLIGHGYDDPARLAFFIGHEAGHVANADCAVEQPVVDDQNDIPDADPIEKRADQYSADLLLGDANVPPNDTLDFRSLAAVCAFAGKPHGADPAALAWAWAERTKEFQTASMAVQALYRARGGKRILRELVDENLNLGDAAESDRSLLRCLYGDPERNATSG